MSDTPRTDAENARTGWPSFYYDFARTLERELAAAKAQIAELEADRDKEWFQVIESFAGFHPVSITDALKTGIERSKRTKDRIAALEANQCEEEPSAWNVPGADPVFRNESNADKMQAITGNKKEPLYRKKNQ